MIPPDPEPQPPPLPIADFAGYTAEDEHPLDTWSPHGSIIFEPLDWADD